VGARALSHDAYHEDCNTKLVGGYCPKCGYSVDMQSIYLKKRTAMKQIQFVSGSFTVLEGTIDITIPAGAQSVALRVYRQSMTVGIFLVVDSAGVEPAITRRFLVTAQSDLPANYLKYVATLPFFEGGVDCHILEVVPA
jgi:hypothetical protein